VERHDLANSFFSSDAQMNCVATLDRRVFVDHSSEEARDAGGDKRNQGKREHCGAKLLMIPEVATVLPEYERPW
jgi:hypothetical protein